MKYDYKYGSLRDGSVQLLLTGGNCRIVEYSPTEYRFSISQDIEDWLNLNKVDYQIYSPKSIGCKLYLIGTTDEEQIAFKLMFPNVSWA